MNMNAYPTQSTNKNAPQREFDLPRAVIRLRARVEDLEPLVEELQKRLQTVCRPVPVEGAVDVGKPGDQPVAPAEQVAAPTAAHINESTSRLEAVIYRLVMLKALIEV